MKKNLNIVILGVLTVASIILAIPFTPLRNSFKGIATKATDAAINSIAVDFNGKIKNARLIAKLHQYDIVDFSIADFTNTKRKMNGRGLNSSNVFVADSRYSAANFSQIYASANTASGQSEGIIPIGQKVSENVNQNADFVGISSKLSTENGTTAPAGGTIKQNANADNNGTGGGTHPGVDPTPPSLPLGSGFICLFSFAIAYVAIKKWN